MKRITDARCARCGHGIGRHAAEGEYPEQPGMPCEEDGCECVDFHWCGLPTCTECVAAGHGEAGRSGGEGAPGRRAATVTAGETAVIHLAGPIEYGRQACRRCGFVFHDYEGRRPATLLEDQRDPMWVGWTEGEEVLVMGERGSGRFMGLVSQLRPDRDTSDEVRCEPGPGLVGMIAAQVDASREDDGRGAWTAALTDPVRTALEAREEVYRRVRRSWWPWSLSRRLTLHAIEGYVRAVLLAYSQECIEGWPPGPDGQPTVDHGLMPRRRRRATRRGPERRRAVRVATAR